MSLFHSLKSGTLIATAGLALAVLTAGSAMAQQCPEWQLNGIPITTDADTAWVFPMDGQTVWPRTSPGGRPAAYVTRNAGRTWQRLDQGLPETQAWWTVKRQAMTVDAQAKPALYLGNTGGELWIGDDEGARWRCLARHLPEIYAVEVAALG